MLVSLRPLQLHLDPFSEVAPVVDASERIVRRLLLEFVLELKPLERFRRVPDEKLQQTSVALLKRVLLGRGDLKDAVGAYG